MSSDNAVFKLYSKRVDKLVYDCCLHMKKEVWGRDGEQLRGKILGAGFGLFTEEIEGVMKGLIAVFQHSIVVHNQWYTKLILKAIQEHVEKTAAAAAATAA